MRMFGADTSRPVMVDVRIAPASRNTSEPVPHPRSRMSSARLDGACRTTISHMRADRSSGAEHVLSENSLAKTTDEVRGAGEGKSIRMRGDVIEKALIGGKHAVVAAESALTVRQQDDHATGTRDAFGAIDPHRDDFVRSVSEKPEAAVARHRQGQLEHTLRHERPRARTPVVRHGKQAA